MLYFLNGISTVLEILILLNLGDPTMVYVALVFLIFLYLFFAIKLKIYGYSIIQAFVAATLLITKFLIIIFVSCRGEIQKAEMGFF